MGKRNKHKLRLRNLLKLKSLYRCLIPLLFFPIAKSAFIPDYFFTATFFAALILPNTLFPAESLQYACTPT